MFNKHKSIRKTGAFSHCHGEENPIGIEDSVIRAEGYIYIKEWLNFNTVLIVYVFEMFFFLFLRVML